MASYYTGESGKEYFNQRIAQGLNDEEQADKAQLFRPYVLPTATVLDFGCGSGGILEALPCARRLGIEINAPAAKTAVSKRIDIFGKIAEVPDAVADVVITNHALEHVRDPFTVLSALRLKLKRGGRIIVVVPAEEPRHRRNREWKDNPEQHLYSWNPKTLGNLLIGAGFELEESYCTEEGYSGYFLWSRRIPPLFRAIKAIYARLRSRHRTVCVGRRPA